MLKLSSRSRMIVLSLLAATACGGGKGSGENTTPEPVPAPVPPEQLPQDLPIEYTADDVPGTYFNPEALEAPAMPQVTPKKKTTLEQQRKKVAKAPKKRKAAETQLLASMLWSEADKAGGKGKELREEARTALQAARAAGAEDELTLQMLATAGVWLRDEAAAVTAYEELVQKFPASKGAVAFKTWLAYFYLRSGKSAEAAKLVEGWDAASAETPALSDYVIAWVKFRSRDAAGARVAIEAAAKGWVGAAGREALLRDVQLFEARSGAPAKEAAGAAAFVVGKEPNLRALAIYKLHEAFVLAGRYDRAVEVLDLLAEAAVPEDLVSFRYYQSDYEFRQNHPLEAAQRATAAWEALGKCPKCAPQTKEAVAKRISDLARIFHATFAASLDDRHAQAAKVMYSLYLTTGSPDVETVKGYLNTLEQTIAKANKADGKHDKGVMLNVMRARKEALVACYEASLNAEPDLTGSVKLIIDVAASGEVTGVASEPAAGASGVAAVADCMAKAVREWTYPSRTVPGTTRLVYPLNLKPQAK